MLFKSSKWGFRTIWLDLGIPAEIVINSATYPKAQLLPQTKWCDWGNKSNFSGQGLCSNCGLTRYNQLVAGCFRRFSTWLFWKSVEFGCYTSPKRAIFVNGREGVEWRISNWLTSHWPFKLFDCLTSKNILDQSKIFGGKYPSFPFF